MLQYRIKFLVELLVAVRAKMSMSKQGAQVSLDLVHFGREDPGLSPISYNLQHFEKLYCILFYPSVVATVFGFNLI